ncbi:endopolyphosphatase [Nannizzia gypsea CBS 118893]|uniref:Endopolyphosphatase n=1 Tax=Arthroderma gypseum (strain ATCC MYA-4604 / CBS 118893) TaxID=535722 RepID=E4UTP6_ARTGP|nr:endopolyphosphatase [Nannizzia gypsea CBS 118893]EFR01539.1 endopolyphosphatase [Nannizzia gypsea CBS 118893]
MAPGLLRCLLLLTAVGADAAALRIQDQDQAPLATAPDEAGDVQGQGHTGLHGRFLHITDIHADMFYKAYTKVKRDCHRGHGVAGFFGTPGTDCDSPKTLLDATFDWIGDNLRDKVDFVIWTGDAARHDKDERRPRSEKEIVSTNQLIFDKFVKTFHKPRDELGNTLKVPIIPTFGNNDIMPHNIMESGPNRWTHIFGELWRAVIPEEQRHSFAVGGWFYVEAIPEKLAVISLNTMYFYSANSAVDGCNSKYEPGFEHMEWLRTHLQLLRNRGMKAIVIGHVPPAQNKKKKNWSGSCWQKYAIWMKQYRDVVVGSFYGHMNVDHFILQDFNDIRYIIDGSAEADTSHQGQGKDVSTMVKMGYLRKLKKMWSKLPQPPRAEEGQVNTAGYKKELKKYHEERDTELGISLRVVEYNISGIENPKKWPQPPSLSPGEDSTYPPDDDGDYYDDDDDNNWIEIWKKHKKHKKNKKKYPKFTIPDPPSPTAPPGPAYSNQPFSLLGYQQYYANLTELNLVHDRQMLEQGDVDVSKKEKTPKDFYQLEYDTRTDQSYQLPDMTLNSYLELARRIAREEEVPVHDTEKSSDGNDPSILQRTVSLWTLFRQRAFVGFLNARIR